MSLTFLATLPHLSTGLVPSSDLLQELPTVILSTSLTPSKHLLTRQVANTLKRSTLLKLPCDALVHTILNRINVLIACDLGLVEVVWCVSVISTSGYID